MKNINEFFAFDAKDTKDERIEKTSIFLISILCISAGLLWAALYYFFFSLSLTTFLPLSYVFIASTSLLLSHYKKNHFISVYTQIACIICVPTLVQWHIGKLFDSGFVLIWGLCGPLVALMFLNFWNSLFWFLFYILIVLLTFIFNDSFQGNGFNITDDIRKVFFISNITAFTLVVFIFMGYFVISENNERRKSNKLLLNILPKNIVQTLKDNKGTIASHHHDVSVLFADIVGFTYYTSRATPTRLVSKLNEFFYSFDELTNHYDLEKIKTIGDAYMVVGGLTNHHENHTLSIARLALDMLATIKKIKSINGVSFSLRIGIHRGAAIAGVIGKSKFSYDLWGDTVNVASRMESSAAPNTIHVSKHVYHTLLHKFRFIERGNIKIKGKGTMQTYYLTGNKQYLPLQNSS